MQEGGRFTCSCSELFLISCKVLLFLLQKARGMFMTDMAKKASQVVEEEEVRRYPLRFPYS